MSYHRVDADVSRLHFYSDVHMHFRMTQAILSFLFSFWFPIHTFDCSHEYADIESRQGNKIQMNDLNLKRL